MRKVSGGTGSRGNVSSSDALMNPRDTTVSWTAASSAAQTAGQFGISVSADAYLMLSGVSLDCVGQVLPENAYWLAKKERAGLSRKNAVSIAPVRTERCDGASPNKDAL